MAVKVFGASLLFSYLFLCIMSDCGYKNITEDEFNHFKGVDVAATCGNAESMQKVCIQIGKSQGINKALKKGFPKCENKRIQLQKNKTPGSDLVYKEVKLLVCSWEGNSRGYYFSKGQGPNHVMDYNCDPSSCLPYSDIKIQ